MGIRFRKSIKLMPGVRLNLSRHGLSATVGPRGMSVNVGRKGAYLNAGLPGTGISSRTRLGAPSGRQARVNRGSDADAELEALLAQSDEEFLDGLERDLGRLSGDGIAADVLTPYWRILLDREREPFDWNLLFAPQAPPDSAPFQAPAFTPPPRGILDYLPGGRRRRAPVEEAARREHERVVDAARAEHDRANAVVQQEWDAGEAARGQFRTAVQRQDLELLASVLEVELSNEDLPAPLSFELEIDDVDSVRLEFFLMELGGDGRIPGMSKKDSKQFYLHIATATALRLVHEVLRVLPSVQIVDLVGVRRMVDVATGHEGNAAVLALNVTRSAFLALELDRVEAPAAFAGLGGRVEQQRDGELKPLAGVVCTQHTRP